MLMFRNKHHEITSRILLQEDKPHQFKKSVAIFITTVVSTLAIPPTMTIIIAIIFIMMKNNNKISIKTNKQTNMKYDFFFSQTRKSHLKYHTRIDLIDMIYKDNTVGRI